ncbi:hypothetical protein KSP40_PGU019856 [Platanthera guangdongensis]|uniref:Uncharacterized protein n=1 Tax=Platanthera guangdongensis TaxID=2320717 RepID=A0ABR2M361_9ASPA
MTRFVTEGRNINFSRAYDALREDLLASNLILTVSSCGADQTYVASAWSYFYSSSTMSCGKEVATVVASTNEDVGMCDWAEEGEERDLQWSGGFGCSFWKRKREFRLRQRKMGYCGVAGRREGEKDVGLPGITMWEIYSCEGNQTGRKGNMFPCD